MASRDNPKLREIVERKVASPRFAYSSALARETAETIALESIDEVLAPLRELMNSRFDHKSGCVRGEHFWTHGWAGHEHPCTCGMDKVEALCRELLG